MALNTYVALLRGINVGGNRLVSMDALRELCTNLGHQRVQTYVQSGNVVFQSRSAAVERMAKDLHRGIARELGVADVTVVMRAAQELEAAVAANPFSEAEQHPTMVHVLFLAEMPDPALVRAAVREAQAVHPDRFVVSGREAYLWFAKGAGKSKLANNFLEKRLKVPGTARNWNTVNKLVAMCQATASA